MDVKNISSLVLRFRDKDSHDTIQEHQEIITEKGFVWWGWFAKSHEKIPLTEMKYIRDNLSQVDIFLMNCHAKKIYKVICDDVAFGNIDDSMNCPDGNCSPDYYKNYPVPIWYRFTLIEELNDNKTLFGINEDSCLFSFGDYSGFVIKEEIKKHQLNYYYGRKATCFESFAMQLITMFLLRECNNIEDELIDSDKIVAWQQRHEKHRNFPLTYRYNSNNSSKIVVISDMHFSDEVGKHNFELTEGFENKKTLSKAIDDALEGEGSICAMIFPGDFTFRATKSEFEKARNLILYLQEKYKLDASQIAVVPGNHDFQFLKNNNADTEGYKKVQIVGKESQKEYFGFYKDIYKVHPENIANCLARRIMTGNNRPIEIICIDSNILQQDKKTSFVGQGFVGDRQLALIKTEMELEKNKHTYSYRILVLHHHIIPAWYQDSLDPSKPHSVLLDSGRLQKFIKEYRINLVIHGHNHESFCTEIKLPKDETNCKDYEFSFINFGIGSSGATGVLKNCIGILDLSNVGEITCHAKEIVNVEENPPKSNNDIWRYRFNIC